jgi:hypothetical protein
MMTDLNTKCDILSELWSDYKKDKEFADFFEYNDLGLPLAFAISNKIVEVAPVAETYILETFELLCEALSLDSDEDYNSLDEMFDLREDDLDV